MWNCGVGKKVDEKQKKKKRIFFGGEKNKTNYFPITHHGSQWRHGTAQSSRAVVPSVCDGFLFNLGTGISGGEGDGLFR